MNNITLLIKTFNRKKSLFRLLESIHKFYPDIRVCIIDDGSCSIDKVLLKNTHANLLYFYVGCDVGLSEGRNIGVSKVETKYFVLLDDDFYFTEKTDLTTLVKTIESNNFDMVGFDFYDYGYSKRIFRGTYKVAEHTLIRNIGCFNSVVNGFEMYDFILNCFIGKTDFFRENVWDKNIKIGFEHDDFFLNIMDKEPKITHTNKVSINHYPELDYQYMESRHNRENEYFDYFKKKNGVDKILNNGRVRSFKDRVLFALLHRINIYKSRNVQ